MSLERATQRIIDSLVRRGVPLMGARWLEVRGRATGLMRGTSVNPLTLGDATFLVAPRGVTQWVRNVRASGECTVAGRPYRAIETPAAARRAVLDAYVDRWGWQVGKWLSADYDPAKHPVFELHPIDAA